jgi:hypothetical protein
VKVQASLVDKIKKDSFSHLDQDIVPKVNLNDLLKRKKKEDNIIKQKNFIIISAVLVVLLISYFIFK